MKCCVPNCKNDSRRITKTQGITFHVFPNDPGLHISWLKAIGRVEWKPKERSVVCSEHFHNDDIYKTKNGLRKVRVGSVPIILQNPLDGDSITTTILKVCRICLVMDVKLLSIYKLQEAYENLCGISLEDEERRLLPQSICIECAHRLINYQKFRSKSLKADDLMMDILKRDDRLTHANIKTIDREENHLISTLSTKYNKPDYYDYLFENTETAQNLLEYIDEKLDNCIDEIKTENEENDFEQNNDSVIEKSIDNLIDDAKSIEIEKFDDIRNENDSNNDSNDKNYDINYSSSDSLPLEECRKRKVKKKKKDLKNKKSIKKIQKPIEPKVDRRRKPFLNDDLNETLFTITDLSYDEQIGEILKRQESANYKNAVFKCTHCFKGFLDEDAYNSHIARHTNQSGEHECAICKTHFKHQHALRKHITAHHTQRFSCKQCTYVTTHRQTARLHERWHNGTKYSCPHCNHEFLKFTTYMGHIRIKHPSDFVCEICGYSFVSAKGIELHKKLKHRLDNSEIPSDGPFCELCKVRFVSIEAHKRHLSVSGRHNTDSSKDDKDVNRPRRGRRPKDSTDIERTSQDTGQDDDDKKKMYPSQLRKAEGPIPCEQCGIQLEDSRAYHGHFRRVHPDKNRTNYPSMKSPCMCEVCGRMFQSYALLKDHRWVHTGERPFSCDSCGKSFRMRQRLVAHRRVHSAARASYVCALCGKCFTTHSNRQRHMFIHTGLKPFKCEMCGKGFKHASEKRAHITYVHLKKPWPKRARGKRRVDRQENENNDMDIPSCAWPPHCEPKISDVEMMERPVYYNLKI